MALFHKLDQFAGDVAVGVHKLKPAGDSLALALSNVQPSPANAVLADITEIAYTNLSSRAVTITASGQSLGVFTLICADVTLTASGIVAGFRYVILYNTTPTTPLKPLIGWWDQGSTVNMTSGQVFTISFDNTLGVLQLQ
jgi:hypothetical protein